MNLDEACRLEIQQLHAFIQAWMRGSLPQTPRSFERFENSLSDDFLIIHPSGRSDDKTSISEKVYGAHGVKQDDFSIEIRHIRARLVHPPWCLLTYEEWQSDAGKSTARFSSVLFYQGDDGLEWVHLQETWLGKDQ
jgi:hypothetical protein